MYKISTNIKTKITELKRLKSDLQGPEMTNVIYKSAFNFLGQYVVPLIPFEKGDLRRKTKTNKSGKRVFYSSDMVYARRLYYNPEYKFNEPGTGAKWFENAFKDKQKEWQKILAKQTENIIKKNIS